MATFEELVDEWDDDDDEESDYELDSSLRAYVSGADWTVGTILDQVQQGNIDIAPAFQRRSVWDAKRSSRFIESVFLGLPIPQLVLAESRTRPGGFIVLDGKQRLLTLSSFARPTNTAMLSRTGVLQLEGLEIVGEVDGKTYETLTADPRFADLVRTFGNRTIRTVVISGWQSDDYLNLIFRRLNSGSVPLSTQELRQALHAGPFSDELNEYTLRSAPLQRALNLDGPDFRMRDIELALRFVALDLRLAEYSGNLKKFLDETLVDFNEEWSSWRPMVRESLSRLDKGIEAAEAIFGRNAFRRFTPGGYERRFNRAVFDIQTLTLALPTVRQLDLVDSIRLAFEELSLTSSAFSDSLAATTKSIGATFVRLSEWIAMLSRIGAPVAQPAIVDNRIQWIP